MMGVLGRITLGFGAHGAEGDEALSFEAGHINLVVGPNNSGKSLFLRELSGIEPRAEWSLWQRREPQRRIVEWVEWGEERARQAQEEAVAEVVDEDWVVIGERRWGVLVPGLRRAAEVIRAARAAAAGQIGQRMMALGVLDPKLGALVSELAGELPVKGDALDALAVAGGMYLLTILRAELAGGDGEERAVVDAEAAARQREKREHYDFLEHFVSTVWAETCRAVAPLGVATADLSPVEALDLRVIARSLAREVPHGWVSLACGLMGLSEAPVGLDDEEAGRLAVSAKVLGWAVDPKPLEALADELDRAYAGRCWNDWGCREALVARTEYLDGPARLSRTEPAKLQPYDASDDDAPPILALLKSPERRERLRALVREALGAHLVVDMVSATSRVFWRLSAEPPAEGVESAYSEAGHAFHAKATPLSEKSDGIHALVGILASVVARDHDLIFIDEPEAFLHPPLVRKLARQLGQIAEALDRQFFIATHSPEMLASVARGDIEVNVIRLTYREGVPTARLLDGAALRRLALDPLMRSEAVLAALFHEGAVVCEAAADRVVYQEVNERLLLHAGGERGLDGVKFLNAQNWQTVQRMVGPLRELGVAAAAVVDADVVFEKDFKTLLGVAGMPSALRMVVLQRRADLRRDVAGRLKQKRPRLKRDLIAALSDEERAVLDGVFDDCARYGIFVVPVGELEDWLSYLGVARRRDDKVPWLAELIARLGYDRGADDYVWPTEGDVWGFVARIMAWIADPKREGLRVG